MISLKQETLTEDGITVVVSEANGIMGMNRQVLRSAGYEENKDGNFVPVDDDPVISTMRIMLYPDLISSLVSQEGLPDTTFATISNLREQFLNHWLDVVYRLNPHWGKTLTDAASAEKKAPTSESASLDSEKTTKATRRRH